MAEGVTTSLRAERSNPWPRKTRRYMDCFVACAPRNDDGVGFLCASHPPLIGGIVTCSRRQARRSISSQARNWRSLFMQVHTSLSRVLSQATAIAGLLQPGLDLIKASSISAGGTGLRADHSRYSSGIF